MTSVFYKRVAEEPQQRFTVVCRVRADYVVAIAFALTFYTLSSEARCAFGN